LCEIDSDHIMYVCVFFALNIYIIIFYIYKIKYIHTYLDQTDTQMNMLRQYLSYLVRARPSEIDWETFV
jgi:hypothetical protein